MTGNTDPVKEHFNTFKVFSFLIFFYLRMLGFSSITFSGILTENLLGSSTFAVHRMFVLLIIMQVIFFLWQIDKSSGHKLKMQLVRAWD